MSRLAEMWHEVWPNLAANVLWVPVVGVSHWMTRRHLKAVHQDLKKSKDQT